MAKRGATKSSSTPKTPLAGTTKSSRTSRRQAKSETVVDSVAVFIGKNVGKAVKQTRALGARLSEVGSEVVDAGSRAGEVVKGYLPEAIGGKATKPRRKTSAARPRKATTKTAAPKPAHGHDAPTQQASAAAKKPARTSARAASVRKTPASRRG